MSQFQQTLTITVTLQVLTLESGGSSSMAVSSIDDTGNISLMYQFVVNGDEWVDKQGVPAFPATLPANAASAQSDIDRGVAAGYFELHP